MPSFERAIRCLLAIQRGERVTVYWMINNLGISLAQAKRDMDELERVLPVRRTKGYNGQVALVTI
jgi:predicted DNA-binding transcriptional regulator YafY